MQSLDQRDSLGGFIDGLFDLFSNASRIIGNSKVEFLYIPPSKNKKRKKSYYAYKVAHIFLKKPLISLKTNQGAFVAQKLRRKNFNDNIKNIRSNLFFKK